MDFEGWAIFMDCDMLCKSDITNLWDQRDENYSVMCVKHNHIPSESVKFNGEVQSSYPRKNWSSLILFNCSQCNALTLEYVNQASGLDLHRFNWLNDDNKIGEINSTWNHLVAVQSQPASSVNIMHWTLGGPWFKEQREVGGDFASEWFLARENAMRLWD